MKQSLYLENSIFGFYYDEKLEKRAKAQATGKLFDQIKDGMFEAFTSPLTIKELSAAPGSVSDKLLSLTKDFGIKTVDVDGGDLEILVKGYMNENIVPAEFINDATHVAYATSLRVDILVSFNLKHIVNEWNARKFNAVNLKMGYSPLVIRTPEEVIHYDD